MSVNPASEPCLDWSRDAAHVLRAIASGASACLRLPDGRIEQVRPANAHDIRWLAPGQRLGAGRVHVVLASGGLHVETADGRLIAIEQLNDSTARAFLDACDCPPGELAFQSAGDKATEVAPVSITPEIGPYCTIAPDVRLGARVKVFGHANLYGCSIGDDTRIGAFVEIQSGVVVGKRVRVQSHTFICSGIVIEDDVFVGHNVNFINDRYPTAPKSAPPATWTQENTRVCRGASIGTGSVVLCGLTIGEGAVVGAGSVVTHDAPPHTVVAGAPARVLRELDPEEQWHGGERTGARDQEGP